ncbi:sulfatase [soil metagenome]
MNVLYLHCHDAGRYLAPWKDSVPTPNLKKFAEKATVFRQAFCVAPTCSPSRAALLTGSYPHQCGMTGLAHRGFQLSHPERHLAHFLKEQGFQTALCGIQHEFSTPPAEIYDEVHSPLGHKGEAWDAANADWAAQWLSEKKASPFFLSCGFFLPHREFPEADPAIVPTADDLPPSVPDTAETRTDLARYLTAAKFMDQCCGKVLKELAEGPHAADTIIVFTTDHGPPFPSMKCTLLERGLGVALMIDYPDNPQGGRALEGMASHLDIFPTLCELLNLPSPNWLEGSSLLPLIRGEKTVIHDELFAETTFHVGYEPMRSIRTAQYKLIEIFEEDTRPFAANIDPSPSKDAVAALGLLERPRAAVRLFDLESDPEESRDLSGLVSFSHLVESLRDRLREWMKQTGDPLLFGPISPPVGATVQSRPTPEAKLSPV